MHTYWLSFVDPELPAGNKFLGVCIVDAADPMEAVQEAWDNSCNPGGEVAVLKLEHGVDVQYKNTLFNKDDATELAKWVK